MPLLKKTPFALSGSPDDLDANELVYQLRFTKEIFRDYQEYLNRLNFYRRRNWTCKISGKANLTYEEALVSEKHATQKLDDLPKELVTPALQIIQFSMLSLKDLSDTIAAKLQENLFIGIELLGRKGDDVCPCKVLNILVNGTGKSKYEVAWLDKNKNIIETAVLKRDDLTWKKLPFSRRILKSFIRESTYRSAPWVLNEKLAHKHGISSDPPKELKDKVFIQDGLVCNKKTRKNIGEVEEKSGKCKRKKVEGEQTEVATREKNSKKDEDHPEEERVRYPIDDLLLPPGADDQSFTNRPSPLRDFKVSMGSVGDLLMVWDFCSSFGRLLRLWPFSLEDFENAICHKDSNLTLIVEIHSALLLLLIKDSGEYFSAVQKRNRKPKITLVTWTEYLCDFVEMIDIPVFSTCTSTIKRGHYGLLDTEAKLGLLRELVNRVLETNLFRDKLDEYIEQRQALGATRREEALEEARKKREEKEGVKANYVGNGAINGNSVEQTEDNLHLSADEKCSSETGKRAKKRKEEVISSGDDHELKRSESNHSDGAFKDTDKKQNMDVENGAENIEDLSRRDALKHLKDEKKETTTRRSKEQRREYFEREMEKRVLCTHPLGKDRHYNRYWWFRRDGRIFVESSDSKMWGYYTSKEELNALMGSLNCKGVRERALHKQLGKLFDRICLELQKRSKDLANKIALEEAVLRRSTRVRALPRENLANGFLRYINKWKDD